MIYLRSGCKINLFLKIGAKEKNGLHKISSLFLPLAEPADLLCIEGRSGNEFEFICPIERLNNNDNLVCRAWQVYAKASGFRPGLRVSLLKNVPWGAGLGGGSGNAAAMLAWLNSVAPRPLSDGKMLELGRSLGSDVPFFLRNVPALVEGTGNLVKEACLADKNFFILLVWPEIEISTAWAYAEFDKFCAANGREKSLTKHGFRNKNLVFTVPGEEGLEISQILENDFEEPVFAAWPTLLELKGKMQARGATYSGMSGSGSTIFGIFEDIYRARKAWTEFSGHYEHVFLAQYPNAGV